MRMMVIMMIVVEGWLHALTVLDPLLLIWQDKRALSPSATDSLRTGVTVVSVPS